MPAKRATSVQQGTRQAVGRHPTGRLLVVEPEELLRWSISKYLSQWFDVCQAPSLDEALTALDAAPVDAVVVSEDLADDAAGEIDARAHTRNASAVVVHTVTDDPCDLAMPCDASWIEKPFELSALARLLGVSG